jgi:hypothetical protein
MPGATTCVLPQQIDGSWMALWPCSPPSSWSSQGKAAGHTTIQHEVLSESISGGNIPTTDGDEPCHHLTPRVFQPTFGLVIETLCTLDE